jgi:hypothetical protein
MTMMVHNMRFLLLNDRFYFSLDKLGESTLITYQRRVHFFFLTGHILHYALFQILAARGHGYSMTFIGNTREAEDFELASANASY